MVSPSAYLPKNNDLSLGALAAQPRNLNIQTMVKKSPTSGSVFKTTDMAARRRSNRSAFAEETSQVGSSKPTDTS